MITWKNRIGWTAGALIAASASLMTPSFAAPAYDGMWTVSLVTTSGACVASYRYPMRVEHGVLANGGGMALTVSGRVAANGAVNARLHHGDTTAAASGRLSGNTGRGSWRAAECSGSWTAERRSS